MRNLLWQHSYGRQNNGTALQIFPQLWITMEKYGKWKKIGKAMENGSIAMKSDAFPQPKVTDENWDGWDEDRESGWIPDRVIIATGNLRSKYPLVMSKQLLKMAIYSGFSIKNGDFPQLCQFTRGYWETNGCSIKLGVSGKPCLNTLLDSQLFIDKTGGKKLHANCQFNVERAGKEKYTIGSNNNLVRIL